MKPLWAKNLPGQNDHLSRPRNRVALIKQWLAMKNSRPQQSYRSARKTKKRIVLTGTATIAVTLFLIFFILDGQARLRRAVESITMFQVSELLITGNGIVADQVLKDASGITLYQTSLLVLNKQKLKDRIESVPWIASAEIVRTWPSTVEIAVQENIPLALIHGSAKTGAEFYYMDKNGVSFLPVTPGGNIDFPVVTGLAELPEGSVRQKAFAEVLLFLKKVRGNDPHLPLQSLSEVHVTPEGEMVVYLVDYTFPIFFGNGNTGQKYARLVQVLKALYKKGKGSNLISEIEYIQMDYLQDKVLVAQTGSE
ncbi:cell division protein FtsQ/DivIB [Desulforhopalus singaporensis]|uniref:cell division protein FtsQ/DivIB n=1 Tax=Desulforhopalus singaporensis TaxID=91360 RepID=UPI0015A04DF8|nr:FtsQ-type POTRA domain-containing protein [Desulforhopalus singaporensis]